MVLARAMTMVARLFVLLLSSVMAVTHFEFLVHHSFFFGKNGAPSSSIIITRASES